MLCSDGDMENRNEVETQEITEAEARKMLNL
jgi:hypothetical protein